jgi:hypothetical protein
MNDCLFRWYSLYMEINVQADTNSYVSLKFSRYSELLYTEFNKFRDKVFLHIFNENFLQRLSTASQKLER